MKLSLNISRITIVKDPYGPDAIFLMTDKPEACWPFEASSLSIALKAASGYGEQYIRENLFPDDEIPEGFIEVVGGVKYGKFSE